MVFGSGIAELLQLSGPRRKESPKHLLRRLLFRGARISLLGMKSFERSGAGAFVLPLAVSPGKYGSEKFRRNSSSVLGTKCVVQFSNFIEAYRSPERAIPLEFDNKSLS